MRFSKSSIKTHIVRGATSKQAKSRSVQKAGPSCEKNSFYWCKNHSDNFLWFFSDSCSKGFQTWAQAEVPASSIKGNQISSKVWFKGFTKGLSSRQWIFSKTSKAGTFVQIGQKQRKTSQTKRFPTANQKKGFLDCVSFWHKKDFLNGQKVSPKTALQGLSPDGLHGREL